MGDSRVKRFLINLTIFTLLSIVSQPSFSQQNREEELKKIVETGKENEEVVDALNELALLNQPTNHNKSLEYAEDAAKIARKIFYPKGIALAQSIAGDLYADKFDRHDKAIECYIEAFSNYKLLYKQGLLSQEEMNHFILDDFMHSYQLIMNKEVTTRKEKKALKQYKDLQAEVAPYLVTIASAAITKSKEGEKEIEKVKTIAAEKEKELKEKEKELKEKQETLQQQHWELRKKQKQAQELAKIKSILSDSLFNTSIFLNMTADSLKYVLEQLVEQRAKAQTEKMQQVLDDIERRSQIEAIEHEKQRQQKNTTILLIILGMSSAICAVYYVGYRRQKKLRKILEEQNEYIKKQNEEIIAQRDNIAQQKSEIERQRDKIREKNEQITASINYAERIQRSILPDDEEIQSALPDSFVLFKPRDVVSGDFYWFDNTNKEGKIIISAIDCTGHGVPGALMSMIGNTLMNEIVHHKKILSPELILNELNKEVCKALRQNETGGRDGMDMTICVIDKKNKILEFAGANNPLIYIQDRQIHRIKGDAMPVGGVHFNKKAPEGFTKHVVDCSKETCFYIFSDGFQDQFGGPKDMKFMAKRMAKLILNIHDQPMFIQKEILYEALVDWMGGEGEHAKYRQVDDILVIGVRLKFN